MSSHRGNRGGRTHPHQRETNNEAATIGASIAAPADLEARYNETLAKSMDSKSRRNYRQRLARIIRFWKSECPEYYAVGVRTVAEPELSNPTKYHFGKTEDVIYEGINEQFVLHFLVSTKKKADEKTLKSYDDLRKYKDAIMWGAKQCNVLLPAKFYDMFDKFLPAYKKEFTSARKNGNVDEHAADPIPVGLFRLLLKWSLDSNNVFVWVWTVLQWSCMARCASIDPLKLQNLTLGTDSIVAKYDDSKTDKAGERLSEKNIYANPYEWRQCCWTALGLWLALRVENMKDGNAFLFLEKNVKNGVAAKKYCEQVVGVIKPHMQIVVNHMKIKNFNPYGLRKGSATHAVSGTTVPPPIPSIARRGEWSIGSVLDLYWHFGSVGDHYLGRILAGLNPTKPEFDCLPPHWNLLDPFANEDIKRGMVMTYGVLVEEYLEFLPFFLRVFACIIYHSEDLLKQMAQCPGHDFCKLAILHDRELLVSLKTLVTLEPTEGGIESATGIPPHITQTKMLEVLLTKVGNLIDFVTTQSTDLVNNFVTALENRDWEAGHVTGDRLKSILKKHKEESMGYMKDQFKVIAAELHAVTRRIGFSNNDEENTEGHLLLGDDNNILENEGQNQVQKIFSYEGCFYFVPQHFEFPRAKLLEGLRFWLLGQTTSADGKQAVRPFRQLTHAGLPKRHQNKFKVQWKPIFTYLEDGVSTKLPKDTTKMTTANISDYYNECVALLKKKVSYCFKTNRPLGWTLSTWSNRIQRSSIEKMGSVDDKKYLKQSTNRNKARIKTSRKRGFTTAPRYPSRQARRLKRQPISRATINSGNIEDSDSEESDEFMRAFEGAGVMTETMRQREADIILQEEKLAHDDAIAAREERLQNGDVVTRDGTKLFFSQRTNQQQVLPILATNSVHGPTVRKNGCSIEGGCKFPNLPVRNSGHRCHRCGVEGLHNLCCQAHKLTDDDNEQYMYCSKICKTS